MTEPKTAAMFGSNKSGYGRVLLVEDDPGICEEMRATLETAGFEVLEADTEDRAIGVANEGENPLLLDVVVTDIDKNLGVGSLNYFKSQFPHISLIALTGVLEQKGSGSSAIRIGIVGAGKGGGRCSTCCFISRLLRWRASRTRIPGQRAYSSRKNSRFRWCQIR